jgi:hypothetical protein
MTMTTYTTTGSVRGSCRHQHRTIEAAYRCIVRDSRGCERQGGYTDRHVQRTDGTPLSAVECEQLDTAIAAE